jgi:hypothetical protein
MEASLYQPLFLLIITLLCLITGSRYLISSGNILQQTQEGWLFPFALSIVFVLWIGMRPVSGAFGDTVNYALGYANMNLDTVEVDWHSEWIWQWFTMGCKKAGLSVHLYFTLIETGYILSAWLAVRKFLPTHPMLGMLFVWSSLMFFTFGTNGLRNGLACHLILLAMAFLFEDKYIVGGFLCLVAFGIHRSVMLPVVAILAGIFLIRNPKVAIAFWVVSIGLSQVAGGPITAFFASLGFDERMSSYTSSDADMSQFSSTGFRWDFLLYSAMPVLMAWYVCVKRQIQDNWYNALCVTYCLCNAFWIIVIRSSFSNRFAYLSWFLYPLMIVYPLVNLPVWRDQDQKTGLILLSYCGFTLFMQFVYW